MAVKAADQLTIVDVTDAYSVMLTSEAYTFVGNTSGVASGASCTTQAVAYCGTNRCSAVSVTVGDITCPNGISASVSGSGSNTVTITFTTTATVSDACEATIPVVVDGITVNKKFSFAVAKQGAAGSNGTDGADGADAITIVIHSSNGSVFKNSSGSTVLTAYVFVGGVAQTTNANGTVGTLGTLKWYKGTSETVVATANTLTVNASDVTSVESYTCQLEG